MRAAVAGLSRAAKLGEPPERLGPLQPPEATRAVLVRGCCLGQLLCGLRRRVLLFRIVVQSRLDTAPQWPNRRQPVSSLAGCD